MEESLTDGLEKKIKNAFGDMLLAILFSLIRPIATMTEIIFRRHIGERYFTHWSFIVGLSLIAASAMPHGVVNNAQETVAIYSAIAWGVIFILCYILHRVEIISRYRKNLRWHSYNYGLPRIPFSNIVIEKIITLALGGVLVYLGYIGVGGLIFLSGMISITLRIREVQEFRNRMLDTIDAQIEHDNLDKAILENLPPQQTEGLRAHMPKSMSKEGREKFVKPKNRPKY